MKWNDKNQNERRSQNSLKKEEPERNERLQTQYNNPIDCSYRLFLILLFTVHCSFIHSYIFVLYLFVFFSVIPFRAIYSGQSASSIRFIMVVFVRSLLLESFVCGFIRLDWWFSCMLRIGKIHYEFARRQYILKVQWYEWMNEECTNPRKKSNNNLKNKRRNNNNQVRIERNPHSRFITLFGNGIVLSLFLIFFCVFLLLLEHFACSIGNDDKDYLGCFLFIFTS